MSVVSTSRRVTFCPERETRWRGRLPSWGGDVCVACTNVAKFARIQEGLPCNCGPGEIFAKRRRHAVEQFEGDRTAWTCRCVAGNGEFVIVPVSKTGVSEKPGVSQRDSTATKRC
jgi:hypothetical protein